MENTRDTNASASGLRWAFKFSNWKPTQSEWMLASQSVQIEEKERIGKFYFKIDAKAAMSGRLLIRKCINESLDIPWKQIKLVRTDRGKPILSNEVTGEMSKFNFNASHQGDFSVLAAEPRLKVGIDVMRVDLPSNTIPEFFRNMRKQFTTNEWKTIRMTGNGWDQLEMFYRHWCLKESYIKAIGIGLGFDLQRLEFKLGTLRLVEGAISSDTRVLVDGELDGSWRFQETKLDPKHYVAVALAIPPELSDEDRSALLEPPTFTQLEFPQLVSAAENLTQNDLMYWTEFSKKGEKRK